MHALVHVRPSSTISGGATHTGGGPRPPQNFKKLIYSMYIIYILKNIACKIEVGPPKFWVISMILLKEREIILKSYNLRGLTN